MANTLAIRCRSPGAGMDRSAYDSDCGQEGSPSPDNRHRKAALPATACSMGPCRRLQVNLPAHHRGLDRQAYPVEVHRSASAMRLIQQSCLTEVG